jgi:hypothetical protein
MLTQMVIKEQAKYCLQIVGTYNLYISAEYFEKIPKILISIYSHSSTHTGSTQCKLICITMEHT